MNFDSNVLQVAIEDIIPNRFQPRLSFEDSALQDLSDSIKQHGIIQPLVLRRIGDKYEIIAGERRYKAATMAGLASVPAVISQLDDRTSAEVAVVENVQRKDLTAIEEAKSYKALLDQGYMSQEELARRMGLSQSAISNKLRLLSLCEDVQNAVLENKISERHARALLRVKEESSQIKWLNKILEERLTVKQLDDELRKEYKDEAIMTNVDVEKIKEQATDIKAAPVEIVQPTVNESSIGPINLGSQNKNKFFNILEDQAVNMQMTDAVNPFTELNNDSASVSFPTQNEITPNIPVAEIQPPNGNLTSNINYSPFDYVNKNQIPTEIETLDSLDSEPAVENQVTALSEQPQITQPASEVKDITPAVNRIKNIINDLKVEEFNIVSSTTELADQTTITIQIFKEGK